MKKISTYFVLAFISICITGCWDKTELEDRSFVTGIGIDKYNLKHEDKENEVISGQDEKNHYIVNLVLPDTAKISGGSNEDRNIKSAESQTVSGGFDIIDSYSNQKIYFGHTKVCVLGEDLLQNADLLKETLDSLERNRDISRKLIILSSDEDTKDILKADTETEPFIGMFLSDFYKSNVFDTNITFRKDLESVIQNLISFGNTVIPKIGTENDKIKMGGLAVIKDFQLKGWLNDVQTRGYLWLSKEKMGGSIAAEVNNHFVPFKIISKNTKISFEEQDNNLVCNVYISVSGNIEEYRITEGILYDLSTMETLETNYNNIIKDEVVETLNILKEYKSDVIGLNSICKKNYYELFQKYKDDWDNTFYNMKVNINVNTDIKGSGSIK